MKPFFTSLFLASLFFFSTQLAFSQDYNHNTDPVTTCGGNYYDAGGPGGNYPNQSGNTVLKTFTSTNGNRLKFNFQQFVTECCGLDYLTVYDGPTNAYPVIGVYQGNLAPFSVESSGSSLTFGFTSSFQTTFAGWAANIECTTAPLTVYNMSSGTINACSGMFYDNGGPNQNYPTFENRTQTFCSSNGQRLVMTFNNNESNFASGDTLWAYDGNSTSAPLLGIFVSGSILETLTASATCLTFRFKSDGTNQGRGWAAQLSCTNVAPTPIVYIQSSGVRGTCNGVFTDDGGENGNYANLSGGTRVQSFQSTNGNRLKINFQQFVTESGLDILTIHDGPTTAFPVLGRFSGNLAPFSIEGSGTSLTFNWVSSFQTTFAGWRGTFECTTPVLPVYNMSSGNTNTCSGMFFDASGGNANYANFENRTQTFCSNNGQRMVATFNPNETEFASGDTLWAYDGNSTSSPLLGIFVAGSTIETLTASATCLTFRFKSDASNVARGWAAQLSCTTAAAAPIVYVQSSGVRHTCDGIFTDDGGENGNYANLSGGTRVQTFTSYNGNRLKFNFQQFVTESGLDILTIHDGPTTAFPVIGRYSGSLAPFSVEGTGSSLTFNWVSSFQTTFAGWRGTFECTTPVLPVYNLSSGTTNTCSGMFYDASGANSNYANLDNRTQTFCSNNGQRMVATFNPNETEFASGDTLWAYDGNSVSSPLLGIFVAGSTIETLTASASCLTFRFKSDASNVARGWAAQLSCTTSAAAPIVYVQSSGVRYTCNGIFTDDGGENGNYANLSGGTRVQTFTSYNGNRLKINFQQFVTESGLDILTIHDGPTTSHPVIGRYSGNLAPFSVEGSGRSLTFNWVSSFQTTFAGWRGTFECTTPVLPVYNMSSGTITTCGGMFYDAGGASGNYPNFENRTQTFCSQNGEKLQFEFNPLATFLSNGDTLWVFDGNSTAASPLGIYVAGSTIETLTSSGSCITFRFKSNNSPNGGWAAELKCVTTSPGQTTFIMSSGVRYVCSGLFTDDGGPNGNYANLSGGTRIQTFGSYNGNRIRINFQQFVTESGNLDFLQIFDGPSVNSPLIGTYQGNLAPFAIESSGKFLTFRWQSSFQTTFAGWQGFIECTTPILPSYPMTSGTVNACSGVFFDSGGGERAYSTFENRTQTFCSDNGQKIQFVFNQNSIGFNTGDTLWAYNGNSVASPLIGYYITNSFIEPITSTGTCITFRFKSGPNTPQQGWQALFNCVTESPSQTLFPISTGLRVVCSGTFTDEGGLNGNYSNNFNRTQTYQSANGNRLSIVFNSFITAESGDYLDIFDGPSSSFPRIARLSGTVAAGTTITSTGTSLTFNFVSNSSSNQAGWVGNFVCAGPALTAYNMSSGTVNTCSGVFYDNGGGGSVYSNFENRTQSFCSDNGQKIVFEFTNFELEGGDSLWVYDGNSVNAPLIGMYLNSILPEKITATGTCLTFRFKSNATGQLPGWKALISCTNETPAPLVYNMATGIRATCNGIFADDGGLTGSYSNNVNRTMVLQGYNNQRIRLNFQQFSLENGPDYLIIFDGPNNQSPLIGNFTGTNSPGIVTSSGNSLTVWFVSDGSAVGNFAASIECAGPPLTAYNMSSGSVTTCSGVFYDAGGVGQNYSNNELRTQTFCAETGQKIQFNFNNLSFRITDDSLWAYDGNSTSSPLIGIYVGGGYMEPITSTGSCITFRFKSNTGNVDQGWAAIISCVQTVPAVEYRISTGVRVVCSGTFTDPGGSAGNYGNNQGFTQTYRSQNNERLQFTFTQFSLENGPDWLDVWDGPTTAYPYLGRFTGTNNPGSILSSGNSLTFYFRTDGSAVSSGWVANISCAGPALPIFVMSNTPITACEGQWFDAGGPTGLYQNNENYTQTICSNNGQRLMFTFNNRISNLGTGDTLFAYDGNSVSSPLIAAFSWNGDWEPVISSGTCITFRFRSNASSNGQGWAAIFTCTDSPPQPEMVTMRWGLRSICTGIFTDEGGPNGSYTNSQNRVLTFFSSTPGAKIQFNFTQFQTEACCDRLLIYDGPSTASPLLGTYQGTNSPGLVTSTGNALTFNWISDANTVFPGWYATMACVANVPLVGTLVNQPYCAGATISIPFTSPTQSAGNVFTAQLSDANGTFTSPVTIGTLTSTSSGTISATLPTNLTTSGKYRIRIMASNPALAGNPSENITILAIPSQPGTISGSATICAGSNNLAYSVASVTGASSYNWTVPAGFTIVSGQGTNSIVVNAGTQSGTLSVVATNTCGTGTARNLNLTVNQATAPTASISSNAQNNTVCQGGSVTFSSTVSAGNNPVYQWILNGVDFPGANSNSFSLGSLVNNITVALRVTPTSGCFNPSSVTSAVQTITVNSSVTASASISASVPGNTICSGQSVTFTANIQNGGNNPGLQWFLNGIAVNGATGSSYSPTSIQNGDFLQFRLISNATCATPVTAFSNAITMVVNPTVVPTVNISSNTGGNQVCGGNQLILTANIANGGDNPQYQWFRNGSIINGETGSSYITPADLTGSNNFTVRLTSNAICANPTQVVSANFAVNAVSSVTPSVTISSNIPSGQVCVGTSITFTANPTNGGTTPGYQWRINGNPVSGQTGSSFTSSSLANNDQVTVVITSNDPCASPATATSAPIVLNLVNSLVPTVSASSSVPGNSICSGESITFTANPTNGGANPGYVWRINGNPVSGQTGSTFTTSSLTNGQQVSVQLTSSFSCANPQTATSTPITVTVNSSVAPSVSISSSQGNTVCQGTSTTLTANPTNGGNNPQYQWFLNSNAVSGATGATYATPTNLSGTVNYTVQITSNAACVNPASATSQNFSVTFTPSVTPVVSFSSNVPGNAICSGQSITFTASPENGGNNPQYQWLINGQVVTGQTSSTFTTTTLTNGQTVSVRLTSNANCANPGTVTSASQAITVSPAITPSVSVSSNAQNNTICNGQSVTFTASPTNGGTNPQYQWRLNGNDIAGETSATYTSSSLANNSQISVRLTSNASCANPTSATSTAITLTVSNSVTPTASISSSQGTTLCEGASTTLTSSITNGGNSPGYQWLLNGNPVSGATSSTYVTPTTLSGTATYTLSLSSTANCASPTVVVSAPLVINFTPAVIPEVTVTSTVPGNTICEGQSVTFTANPENGGTNPTYQWLLNGNVVNGQTGISYTNSNLANGNTVAVRLTSNAVCANPTVVNSALQTITVTPNSPSSVTVTSNASNNTICPGQTVVFTANPVNGGTSPTYVWKINGQVQAGQTGANFTTSGLANGDQVTVDLTSNSSCANPNTASSPALAITVNPTVTPSVNISSNPTGTSFCAGTPITFTASPVNGGINPAYQWQVNGNIVPNQTGTSFTLNLTNASTVTVVLTSNALCASPATVTSSGIVLGIAPPPNVVAQADTAVCEATSAFSLTAFPAGGTWSGSGVSSSGVFAPGFPGIFTAFYQYTDPNTSCTGIDSVKITVRARPTINFPPLQPICANSNPVQLSATPIGGLWTGTGVSANGLFNPTTTGAGQQVVTYTVTQNGCQASKVLVINVSSPPTVDVGGAETVCFSTNQVQLSGIPAGGTWSGEGVSSSGLFTPGFVTPGTTVTLTYTVTVNGCTASGTKQMTVSFNPVTVNAGPDQTVCISDPAFVLTGVTGSGGTWSGTGVSANGVFNPATAGVGSFTLTYTVTFNQSPICAGSDTKIITVVAAPNAPTTLGDTVCRQGVAVLSVPGPPSTYRWYTTATGGNPIPGQTGATYTTPVINVSTTFFVSRVAGSCESNRTPVLAYVNSFDNAQFTVNGNPPLLTAIPSNGQAYQWLLGLNPIASATQNTYQPLVSGDYSVIIQLDGCPDTSAVQFVIVTDVAPMLNQPLWKVFPNPAHRDLVVEAEGLEELKVLDMMGRTIYQLPNPISSQIFLQVDEWADGIYYVELFGNGRREKMKVAVRK